MGCWIAVCTTINWARLTAISGCQIETSNTWATICGWTNTLWTVLMTLSAGKSRVRIHTNLAGCTISWVNASCTIGWAEWAHSSRGIQKSTQLATYTPDSRSSKVINTSLTSSDISRTNNASSWSTQSIPNLTLQTKYRSCTTNTISCTRIACISNCI